MKNSRDPQNIKQSNAQNNQEEAKKIAAKQAGNQNGSNKTSGDFFGNTIPKWGNIPLEDTIPNNNEDLTDEQLLLKIATITAELDAIKAGMNSFNISQDEKMFFERKVNPLLLTVYYMAIASQNVAMTAQMMQNNTLGKKKEIKHAIELSYCMNKEIEDLFCVLKKRTSIFKSGIEQAIKDAGKGLY